MLDDLPPKQYIDQRGYELNQPGSIRIVPTTCRELIERALSERGFTFRPYKHLGQDYSEREWLCKAEGTIDDIILRAIAKIAFNYFTKWQEREFMLQANFDATRRFIRYGFKPQYPLFNIRQQSILGDEPVEGKRRSGHLITVDWATDRRTLLAQVSLFNWLTYSVCLARDLFSGEPRVIRKGHFFDPYSRQIFELGVKPELPLQTDS